MAAIILGKAGEHRHLNRMVSILTPHLEDNTMESDSALACYALYHMGVGVRPYLEPLAQSGEEQQVKLAKLILAHFDQPEFSKTPLMKKYSTMVDDPVVELQPISFNGWYKNNFPPLR